MNPFRRIRKAFHRLLPIYKFQGVGLGELESELLMRLFDRALGTIYIVSGSLDALNYELDSMRGAIGGAVNRGVAIEIVVGPDIDNNLEQILGLAKEKSLRLYLLDYRPNLHFIVVDGKHARIGASHGPVERCILFKTFTIARRLETDFLSLRESAERVH